MINRIKFVIRGALLLDFISAFWLALKYFFRPKVTINYRSKSLQGQCLLENYVH